MNKLNILLLALTSVFLLASCGGDDDIDGPTLYPPDLPKAEVNFKLSLKGTVEPIKDLDGNTIVNLSTDMKDVTTLILVVHEGLTGEIKKIDSFAADQISKMKNKDGDYILKDSLHIGRYNITLIACQGGRILGEDDYKPLYENYKDAICNIPMSFIFYDSFAMEELKEGISYSKPVTMNQQTKAVLTYKLTDWESLKAPTTGTNPQLLAKWIIPKETPHLHSAFYIGYTKKGQVLTSADYEKYELKDGSVIKKFNPEIEYKKPDGTLQNKLEIWIPLLNNNIKEEKPKEGEAEEIKLSRFEFSLATKVTIDGVTKTETLFEDKQPRTIYLERHNDEKAFESYFYSDASTQAEPDEHYSSLPK